jgi:hypothetical protein
VPLGFRRSGQVPADVLHRAGLASDDNVLAAAPAKDGSWLLGTRQALVVVPPQGVERSETGPPGPAARVPWEQVERADWDRETERFRVSEVGRFGEVRPEYSFRMENPALLLQLVRERVTASVVLQRRVAVYGSQGLSVIGRRAPSGDGEITWAYEFDGGVDPADPFVMEAAERGLREAEEELGL